MVFTLPHSDLEAGHCVSGMSPVEFIKFKDLLVFVKGTVIPYINPFIKVSGVIQILQNVDFFWKANVTLLLSWLVPITFFQRISHFMFGFGFRLSAQT